MRGTPDASALATRACGCVLQPKPGRFFGSELHHGPTLNPPIPQMATSLPGPDDACADEGRVLGDSCAEQRCCVGRGEGAWDFEGIVLVSADVVGVAAACPAAVLVLGVVGTLGILMG